MDQHHITRRYFKINMNYVLIGIFGGHLLGVRSVSGLAFYDWETQELVRRIEISPKHVSKLTMLALSNL